MNGVVALLGCVSAFRPLPRRMTNAPRDGYLGLKPQCGKRDPSSSAFTSEARGHLTVFDFPSSVGIRPIATSPQDRR